MIKINIVKNTKGKYDFSAVQNGKILYKKEYAASEKDETGLTQAAVFSGYCHYLQDVIDKELEKNPDFHWDSWSDFKKFAGAQRQHQFWEHESEYIKPIEEEKK